MSFAAARLLRVVASSSLWLAAAAVLAIPLLAPGSPVSLVPVGLEQSVPLTISGSIGGLRSEVAATLSLTLASEADASVVVRSVTARVTSASAGCPADALTIGGWAGRLTVPARGRGTAVVPVTLHDPHGSCARATWRLAYTSS